MAYNYSAYAPTTAAAEIVEALGHLSADELSAILVARRIEHLVQPNQNAAIMASTVAAQLSYAVSISAALRELSLRELTVLKVLWRSGLSVTAESIAPAFANVLDRAAVDRCVKRLQDLALLLPANAERSAFFVPSAVRAVLLGRNGPPRPAAEVFGGLNGNVEKLIFDALELRAAKRNRHADRVNAITAHLANAEAVRKRVEALPLIARRVFDYVVKQGGTAEPFSLVQKFPDARKQQAARGAYQYSYGYGGFFLTGQELPGGQHDALTVLQLQGLLVPYPPGWASTFVVVDEVLTALLPPLRVERRDFIEPDLEPPPAEARPAGVPVATVLDLVECLQFINDEKPSLTQKNLFPKPAVKRLAKFLSVQETVYADLLVALLLSGDLLERQIYTLNVRPKKTAAWLAQTELEQRRDLYRKWLELAFWQDDRDEPYPRTADPRGSLAFVRVVAADVLSELPEEGATVASCAGRLRYRMPGWFAGGSGLPTDGLSQNDPVAYVHGVLRALAWLGLAEPLQSPAQQRAPAETVGLRLTPLGRAVMRREEPPADALVPRTDRIIVQPTLDVLAPPNIEPALYYTLRRFTDPAGASGMRTLTLSEASLRRAFDAGMKPQAVHKALAEHVSVPLPNTVERLFADVGAKYGRIHVGQAGFYLTVDDPHLLAELQADKRLKEITLRPIASTVAVVSARDMGQILDRLRQAGHMPVADGYVAQRGPVADEQEVPQVEPEVLVPELLSDMNLAGALDSPQAFLQALVNNPELLEAVIGAPVMPPAAGPPQLRIVPRAQRQRTANGAGGGEKVTDPLAIRELLEGAVGDAGLVEMEYIARRNGYDERRQLTIEPYDITDATVYATEQDTMANKTYKLNRIRWARLLTE